MIVQSWVIVMQLSTQSESDLCVHFKLPSQNHLMNQSGQRKVYSDWFSAKNKTGWPCLCVEDLSEKIKLFSHWHWNHCNHTFSWYNSLLCAYKISPGFSFHMMQTLKKRCNVKRWHWNGLMSTEQQSTSGNLTFHSVLHRDCPLL